ncbi:hypothetical protein ABK040_006153 [Willaertia magna]
MVFLCKICSRTFPTVDNYNKHIDGKDHQKKLLQLEKEKQYQQQSNQQQTQQQRVYLSNNNYSSSSSYSPAPNEEEEDEDDLYYSPSNNNNLNTNNNNFNNNLNNNLNNFNINNNYNTNNNLNNLNNNYSSLGQYYCPICNINSNSLESYQQHLSGKSHLKKVNTEKLIKEILSLAPNYLEIRNFNNNSNIYCKLCEMEMNGPDIAKLHLEGKQHLKNVKREETKRMLQAGSLGVIGMNSVNNNMNSMNVNNNRNNSSGVDINSFNNSVGSNNMMNRNIGGNSGVINNNNIRTNTSQYSLFSNDSVDELDKQFSNIKITNNNNNLNNNLNNNNTKKIDNSDNAIIVEESQGDEFGFFCKACNVFCNSVESLEDHTQGRKHLKNIKIYTTLRAQQQLQNQQSSLFQLPSLITPKDFTSTQQLASKLAESESVLLSKFHLNDGNLNNNNLNYLSNNNFSNNLNYNLNTGLNETYLNNKLQMPNVEPIVYKATTATTIQQPPHPQMTTTIPTTLLTMKQPPIITSNNFIPKMPITTTIEQQEIVDFDTDRSVQIMEYCLNQLCNEKPEYETIASGPPHKKTFTCNIRMYIKGRSQLPIHASGIALTKKDAKREAAIDACKKLKKLNVLNIVPDYLYYPKQD